MAALEQFQKRLGHQFKSKELLRLALTHPSLAAESAATDGHPCDNQRLEFLGDAVLGLVLSQELYQKFPSVEEGPLTKARAQMVNTRTLAEQARRLHLGEALLLSRGEEHSGGRARISSLADAFEAVIGAVFLDAGYEKARQIILRCFHDSFGELKSIPNLDNPKGELQEILQAESSEAPQYVVLTTSGPDHDRLFECAVKHQGRELARGTGKTKRAAESQAAHAALRKLRG